MYGAMIPKKAILLAAGLGTRLRPLTDHTPKCLVEVNGEPLMARWLRQLSGVGVKDVLINTHYLAHKVDSYLDSWEDKSLKLHVSYEESLLGTAGTLKKNSDFFCNSPVLIAHADNVLIESLGGLIESHERRPENCIMTMLTFKTEDPRQCGIVITDKQGIVKEFYEKPANAPGNNANAAIYIMEKSVIDFIMELQPPAHDISLDVIPRMLNRIYTKQSTLPLFDIGTKESLTKARAYLGNKE